MEPKKDVAVEHKYPQHGQVRQVYHPKVNVLISSLMNDELLYKEVTVNGVAVNALIDTGGAVTGYPIQSLKS